MKYTPKPTNNVALTLIVGCFLCTLVCFVSSAFDFIWGKWLLQLLGIGFLTAAIFVTVRYKMTAFSHILRAKNGVETNDPRKLAPSEVEFAVQRTVGNRVGAYEFIGSLGDLVKCVKLPQRKKMRVIKSYIKSPLYMYTVQILPESPCLLLFENDSGKTGVVIEADDKLEAYLSAVARYNSEN